MQENATIARPYARAVFAQAQEEGTLPAWSQMLTNLAAVMMLPEVRRLIHNPRIADESLEELLLTVLAEPTPTMKAFLRILIQADRLSVLAEIQQQFDALYAEERKITTISIHSAFPLSPDMQEELQTALARRHKQQVEINFTEDAALIGGVVIRYGDCVIDASVRGQLQQMHNLSMR